MTVAQCQIPTQWASRLEEHLAHGFGRAYVCEVTYHEDILILASLNPVYYLLFYGYLLNNLTEFNTEIYQIFRCKISDSFSCVQIFL